MDQTVSAKSLDHVLDPSSAANMPKEAESALGRFSDHALASLKYNLVQVPVSAVTELVDHEANTNYLPKVQMFEQPKKDEVGTAEWLGDVCGSTAAAAVPLILFHKMVGPGAATAIETSADYSLGRAGVPALTQVAGLGRAAMPALAKTAGIGLVYGGLLTPTDGKKENFWLEKGENAMVSALALTTMTAGSIGLKATGKALLTNDVLSSGISGALAGEIDVDGHSLLQGKGFASKKEHIASIAAWSVGSALGGAANTVHEYISPSSGIRGVRTLADMTRLADSTVKPGHPERFDFESQQANPVKAEMLSDADLHEWYNRSSSNLRHEIDNSVMPIDWKKQIVSGHQDFTYGLDALANRPEPKPIAVIYGSARLKENDFRYQRARYLAGRLVQEGYDVMTGGGPGIMEAANKGAYEAGGNSIGVVLKLPMEKRGNGYQTLTLKHRNFYTRMENLKKASVFIGEEPGIGTGAEDLDTLTHIQTGKLAESPTYLVGKKTYGFMDQWLAHMQKSGTISPSDRNLYKIVDDPEAIIRDLKQRQATQAQAQKAAADLAGGQSDQPQGASA